MRLILSLIMLLFFACDNNDNFEDIYSNSWVFVANEGNMGSSDGTISMISENGYVLSTDYIGEVVNSIEVYNDKLVVIINGGQNLVPGDSKIKIFDITTSGLSMPGIEINLDNSSPREMVIVDGMVYFTNWNTSDIKVLNLYTYNIDASILVGSMPEDIITDGTSLWVANSGSSTVQEIDIASHNVVYTHFVDEGPQSLAMSDGAIYVSRTYYSPDWSETYHGASKIVENDVIINTYGSGSPCGGSILTHDLDVMRSYNGGLARIDSELNLEEVSIGLFEQWQVYHVEKINGNFWFAVTDYQDMNEVHVLDDNGSTMDIYKVGQNPGDFVIWQNND